MSVLWVLNAMSEFQKKKVKLDRFEYLHQLVVEFRTTESKDAKEQVLGNLSNFAYDPVNYLYFRQLDIIELFLDNLSNVEENIVKFSISALCNLCLDPINKTYINCNGLKNIVKLLEHHNTDILLSTITTLMFLMTPESKEEITSSDVIKAVLKIPKGNPRFDNLATIFLQDYCAEEQIKKGMMSDPSEIPLPDT